MKNINKKLSADGIRNILLAFITIILGFILVSIVAIEDNTRYITGSVSISNNLWESGKLDVNIKSIDNGVSFPISGSVDTKITDIGYGVSFPVTTY